MDAVIKIQPTASTGNTKFKHMNRYQLGKKRAVIDSRTLRFGAYLKPGMAPPPDSVDYGKAIQKWPMYLNDQYGDCTVAAVGHMIQDWTANAGGEVTPTDNDVLKFYEHFTTPGPENGCNMLDVLKFWKSKGFGSKKDKITAFAKLELGNITEAKDSVNLFGSCYIGVSLPDSVVPPGQDWDKIPWVVPSQGPVGSAAPNPNNGHCICAVAYDSRNMYIVSWGVVKSMSWQFYQAYADESYAVLSNDFLKGGKAPTGFDLAQLKQDLNEISGVPSLRASIRHLA
jgi:hypothetical protein